MDLNRCKSPAKNLASHFPGLFLFAWFWPGGVFSSSGWKNFSQEWSQLSQPILNWIEFLRLKICFWSSDWANNITPCLYFLQSQRWNVPQRLSQGKADWFSKAQQPNGSNASKCNLPNYPSASPEPFKCHTTKTFLSSLKRCGLPSNRLFPELFAREGTVPQTTWQRWSND